MQKAWNWKTNSGLFCRVLCKRFRLWYNQEKQEAMDMVGGYLYARRTGKPVRYLEPMEKE